MIFANPETGYTIAKAGPALGGTGLSALLIESACRSIYPGQRSRPAPLPEADLTTCITSCFHHNDGNTDSVLSLFLLACS